MDFLEELTHLSVKIKDRGNSIKTEQGTKNAFVMPFINSILGYDVFNPLEVVPEFTLDVGTKKGEKVDYAILKDSVIQILIECKKYGENLNLNHASQLYRYFSVTTVRIAILTNGRIYQFFTDLEAPNKMDENPFLELDLLNIDEDLVTQVKKLTKSVFDIESIISTAGELKSLSKIKRLIEKQFIKPDDDFVKFFIPFIYEGTVTQGVREKFSELIKKGLIQFLNAQINERLKSAIKESTEVSTFPIYNGDSSSNDKEGNGIVTTVEEIEGYYIVKAIIRSVVDPKRIIHRDTLSYFSVLLDDNNRKPICRLYFNRSRKYIGIFNEKKTETRYSIKSLDEIFNFSAQLKKTISYYETPTLPETSVSPGE